MIGPLDSEDSDWPIDYSSLDIHIDRLMDENDSLLGTKNYVGEWLKHIALRLKCKEGCVPGDVDNFVNLISLYPIKGDKAQINHQRYLFELHQLFFGVLKIVSIT